MEGLTAKSGDRVDGVVGAAAASNGVIPEKTVASTKHVGQRIPSSSGKSRTSLEAPEQVRSLEVRREGDGWALLDWKEPVGGGKVAAFRVQFRSRREGPWRDVGMAVETEILLSGQERGLELEYHVIAVNKAGEGKPSSPEVPQ